MKVMVLVKANADTEAGKLPSTELLTAMGNYNEELAKAGILVAAEGIQPSSKGKKVKFVEGKTTVIDGPFTEAKELIAGFWLIQARSLDEAIEWVKRAPMEQTELEIRQVFETEEFGDVMSPELMQSEQRLREQLAQK